MNDQLKSGIMGFKTKRQKFGVSSLLFLVLFGAAFTAAGVFAIKSNEVNAGWKTVGGKTVSSSSYISDGSKMYTPVVEFKVDGQSYTTTSRMSSSSAPRVGEGRQVAYNPSRPDESKVIEGIGSTWWLYLFPIVGIVCLVAAPYTFIRSLKRGGDIDKLMRSGQKLQGVLVDVQSQGSSGDSGYKIVVAAIDTAGVVQNYTSDSLTGIGALAMADFRNKPIPIDVYVDPTNVQSYYVDVSDIPNLTPERISELIKFATQNK